MNKFEKAQEIVKNYGQEHLLKFYDNLEKGKQEELLDQILETDFELLKKLYENINVQEEHKDEITPIPYVDKSKMTEEELEKYRKIGEEEIKKNKYAIVTMAGGQGTRLGHNGPKGTFKLELNGETKSLFEIIVDKLKDAYEKYNVYLNCYIMTSPENNKETVAFFEKNNYFNYPKEYIKFFMQEDLPLLNKKGKLILGEDGLIKLASEGNGGIFYSMAKKGIIDDMKSKNIKWIFIGSVDNLLVKYVDTLLLGLAIKQNVNIATRTVIKNSPNERVGVLCKKNGKVKVIEYTEVPKEMRVATDEAGEFLYGESHIMCNLFSLEAIEKASTKELKYHVAVKKIKYIDENGKLVNPTEPNCYKFEKFVFDSFGLFDEIAILRGKREEDFAPIKNAEGQDSPETAQKLYENYIAKNV